MKDILYWNPKTQKTIDGYPEAVLDRINFELVSLQSGYNNASSENENVMMQGMHEDEKEDKNDFPPAVHKSMRETIGQNARQITIKSIDSYRVIYVAKFEEAIYILHTFKKKTEGTSKRDYTPAKQRYKDLEKYRKENKLR